MASNAKNLAEYLNNETTSATADIADGSITTAKLAADAVTAAKLADNAVVTANISAGTLEGSGVNLGRRNIVMNGNMSVAQRQSILGNQTGISNGYTGVDRFKFYTNSAARVSGLQSTGTAANGFPKALQIDVTTADTSVAAGDFASVQTIFEGKDLQHLKWGTSSAESLTLSFWVKSPKTGVHWVELYGVDATKYNSAQYTVSSADTWEKKTVTFAGETGSSITDDNNTRLYVQWIMLSGSNYTSGTHPGNVWHSTNANRHPGNQNIMDNTSNNFYLTGVQLETGSTATDFEFLRHSDNLNACYRYFQTVSAYAEYSMGTSGSFSGNRTTFLGGGMRAAPTFTTQSNAGSSNSSLNGFGSKLAAGERINYAMNFATTNGNYMYRQVTSVADSELA